MFIASLLWHMPLCSLAAELARANWAPPPPPSGAGAPAPTLLLPAPHPSHGQALQEKPGPDQLPGSGPGPGGRDSSKPSRAESRGCVEAKAAACTRPSARAGEKHRDTHLPGHSGFWNAVVQSATVMHCMIAVCVLFCRGYLNRCHRWNRYFWEHEKMFVTADYGK